MLLDGHRPAAWELLYPTAVALLLLAVFLPDLPARRSGTSRRSYERAPRSRRAGSASASCSTGRAASSRRSSPACAARGDESWGLRGVTFSIGAGEGVALVGAERLGEDDAAARDRRDPPRRTTAASTCDGRVASLLSIDAGLTTVLTGRENAMLLGVLAGLTRGEAQACARRDPGVEPASSDEFDHPVSSYSQGMRARLGFAVAAQARPRHPAARRGARGARPRVPRGRRGVHARAARDRGGIVVAAGHDHSLLEHGSANARPAAARRSRSRRTARFSEVVRAYVG